MCMVCGCKDIEMKHDKPTNVVTSDLKTAAKDNNISLEEVIKNLKESLEMLEQNLEAGVNGNSNANI